MERLGSCSFFHGSLTRKRRNTIHNLKSRIRQYGTFGIVFLRLRVRLPCSRDFPHRQLAPGRPGRVVLLLALHSPLSTLHYFPTVFQPVASCSGLEVSAEVVDAIGLLTWGQAMSTKAPGHGWDRKHFDRAGSASEVARRAFATSAVHRDWVWDEERYDCRWESLVACWKPSSWMSKTVRTRTTDGDCSLRNLRVKEPKYHRVSLRPAKAAGLGSRWEAYRPVAQRRRTAAGERCAAGISRARRRVIRCRYTSRSGRTSSQRCTSSRCCGSRGRRASVARHRTGSNTISCRRCAVTHDRRGGQCRRRRW